MPELPEVEVVRAGLEPHLAGRTIAAAQVLHERSVRRDRTGPAGFSGLVVGRRVLGIRRRGKYLWWVLDDGDAILAHLGMSGQFRVGPADRPDAPAQLPGAPGDRPGPPGEAGDRTEPPAATSHFGTHKHLRIRFTFTDDGPPVDFIDQRTFGGMAFVPGGAELPELIAHIAPDPLEPAFSLDAAVAAIRRRHTEIKRALLDQTVVSGIGNIYADEALWLAKVHYARRTERMQRPPVRAVLTATVEVMTRALAAGGTSFDSMYVNVNGESGYFDRSLHAYGQAGAPCARCGTPIRRDRFMNRSSYFCPKCQRRP